MSRPNCIKYFQINMIILKEFGSKPINLFTVVVSVSKLFLKLAKIAIDIAY